MNIHRICLSILFALTTTLAAMDACAQITLGTGPLNFVEGDSGQQVFSVKLRLSAPSDQAVTGFFAARSVATSTASRGTSCGVGIDYVGTDGAINIPAGEIEQSIDIIICGDNRMEFDEHFFILASSLSGAVCEAGTLADGVGSCLYIVRITNEDFPGIRVIGSFLAEPTSGSGSPLIFQAVMSPLSLFPTTFTLSTRDGTARGNSGKGGCDGRFDFVHRSQTFTIPAGQPFVNFPVTICFDLFREGNETFLVVITNASPNVVVNNGTGVAIILGN